MAGDTRMAGKVALLLWGAQTTQLLVEPPWTPAVWWDRVTLTCQGSGTASATTWYKDGQRWGQEGRDHFTVTDSGTYMCDRPGSGLSPTVSVSNGWLVLQVPARTLLEGDTVTLRCRRWWDSAIGSVSFYHEKKKLGVFPNGTEMCLSPLQLHHNGRYRCKAQAGSWGWQESMPVTVTVHELFTVPVLEGPPEPTEGSSLTLSCLSTPSPLRPRAPLLHVFYRDGQVVGGPQGSPQLLVPAVGVSHSGNYSCEVQSKGGAVRKSSAWFRVRVRMPVANVNITCSVKEVTPQDTGTYRGTGTHRDTVAAGLSGALLFLLLLMGVIVAWHRWHRVAARKNQERPPPDPPAPQEEGEVLYTHVMVTKRAGAPVSRSVPPCHHPPGSPGHLRGAAGTPGATTGTRRHLRECAVTLGGTGGH
ncbi:high affinity immunoglobulin gamma Fc receptor I-like isoform X2 [Motacilla alba alba]|uniref:high affinity immunoglobulin gamma Fc receptor I-like isoform X2 n=1 Tax=Motacilla alba alba TaxID=1094192 RepID=UPI0018D4E77E|nr:high affinity immunoglobulin gamma Fc receptor I-like isoform X2 [Motacilla alba alba]